MDDLDLAENLMEEIGNAVDYEQGIAYALKGLLHVQLWYAKQHREYKQAVAKQRQAQQSMPVPLPAMPYGGF